MVPALLEELSPQLGLCTHVQLEGPVDTAVNDAIIGDVEAVIREALTNISKHARADKVDVGVLAKPDVLSVVVTDDGVGLGSSPRRTGLANLRCRAEQHGGQLILDHPTRGVLRLQWAIPLTT